MFANHLDLARCVIRQADQALVLGFIDASCAEESGPWGISALGQFLPLLRAGVDNATCARKCGEYASNHAPSHQHPSGMVSAKKGWSGGLTL